MSRPRRRPAVPAQLPPPLPPPVRTPRLDRSCGAAGIRGLLREARSRASSDRLGAWRAPAAAAPRSPTADRQHALATGVSSSLRRAAQGMLLGSRMGGDSFPLLESRGGNYLPGVTGPGGGDSPEGMTRWAGIPPEQAPGWGGRLSQRNGNLDAPASWGSWEEPIQGDCGSELS